MRLQASGRQQLDAPQAVELLYCAAVLGARMPLSTDASGDACAAYLTAGDGNTGDRGGDASMGAASVPGHRQVPGTLVSDDFASLLCSVVEEEVLLRDGARLDGSDAIRLLFVLALQGRPCYGIRSFGLLCMRLRALPWSRLSAAQLAVLSAAQLALGTEGAEMAAEVLPAELLRQADAALARKLAMASDASDVRQCERAVRDTLASIGWDVQPLEIDLGKQGGAGKLAGQHAIQYMVCKARVQTVPGIAGSGGSRAASVLLAVCAVDDCMVRGVGDWQPSAAAMLLAGLVRSSAGASDVVAVACPRWQELAGDDERRSYLKMVLSNVGL